MGAGTFPNTNKEHNRAQIVVNMNIIEKNIVNEVKSQYIVKWPAWAACAEVKVSGSKTTSHGGFQIFPLCSFSSL